MAHALPWEHSYKRLAQLPGQLGAVLTCSVSSTSRIWSVLHWKAMLRDIFTAACTVAFVSCAPAAPAHSRSGVLLLWQHADRVAVNGALGIVGGASQRRLITVFRASAP